ASDRDRGVDVGLFGLRLAFGRLRGFVAVVSGLVLADLLAAGTAAPGVAAIGHANGLAALGLLVLLVGFVVVSRDRLVLGLVVLVVVAVVRVRTSDRNRSVDVDLVGLRLAFGGLVRAVAVAGGLALLGLLTARRTVSALLAT